MAIRKYSTHNNPEIEVCALHDGVPEWMKSSLDGWLRQNLRYRKNGIRITNEPLVQKIERKLKRNLTNGALNDEMLEVLFYNMNTDDELKLDVAEALIEVSGNLLEAINLEMILEESGSKWQVIIDDPELERAPRLEGRVDETAVSAYENATANDGVMTDFLKSAWQNAYGRAPDASNAYSDAIKAIEAATWSSVLPNNPKATLSDIIRELENHPQDWKISISEQKANLGVENAYGQMRLIWQGQTDRHGTAKPVAPSQQAAEQAVSIAVSLCQQFSRNLITKTTR